MVPVTIDRVIYYPNDNFFIVGDNSSSSATGITDTSFAGEIIIQAKIEDKPVKEIAKYAFYQCYYLTKVTIHAKLTSINEQAFQQCGSLEYVNIPSTVTFIGWSGFCLRDANRAVVDFLMTVEFNEGRTEKIFINCHGFSHRKSYIIIYPSNIEPLYNPSLQFYDVTSATICAYSSFKFCNVFDTTIGMQSCPESQYKPMSGARRTRAMCTCKRRMRSCKY